MNAAVTRWLARAPDAVFSAWAIVAAFSCYFAMYAYRKPFTSPGKESTCIWCLTTHEPRQRK